VRFLIDENLSPKLVVALQAAYPGSTHVEALGLRGRLDSEIWKAARDGGFSILTKDD
jgi:predicted nuclease of predicted toxin-antitoxin system